MTKTVDAENTQLSELLSIALEGNEIIITENKRPVARLIPITSSRRSRMAGLSRGEVWMSEDFDEALPEEFWTGTE